MTNFLITHPINDECSILHEEIIKLFVILFSTEMLQPVGESTNLFLDLMLEPVDGYSIKYVNSFLHYITFTFFIMTRFLQNYNFSFFVFIFDFPFLFLTLHVIVAKIC